jgi:hypothetical protein
MIFNSELEWKPVFYNGFETNIEVTKCGRVRRVKVIWMKKSGKISEVDFDKLKLHKHGYRNIIIQVDTIGEKNIKVHQLIASAFLKYKFKGHENVVDHIDSNKLNNHLDNLRVVSNRENNSKERTKKSGLPVGVCFNKNDKKYQSYIYINGKQQHLGKFNTIKEASNVYQNKLKEIQ